MEKGNVIHDDCVCLLIIFMFDHFEDSILCPLGMILSLQIKSNHPILVPGGLKDLASVMETKHNGE